MRLASVRPDQLAVGKGDGLVILDGLLPRGASMNDLIAQYDQLKDRIAEAAARGQAIPVDPKQLRPPVPNPSKIWAAAGNYARGSADITNAAGRGQTNTLPKEALAETAFLKPPSAIIGPEEQIIIPEDAESVFPELELCVVIGQTARRVSLDQALEHVFGYSVILDMTARSQATLAGGIATRCVRKGYETFAPLGPWIVTRDEVPDPQNLHMQLWVNGELKQSATTSGMINGVAELVSYLSHVTTLYPGDLIATGNPDSPEFQQSLKSGDTLKAQIDPIGSMTLYVQ
jgi:2-keto-4-pentenoate hydratase/2-oxohepta-3-ene-1,7-dioic acid hydratase in catechol pathway